MKRAFVGLIVLLILSSCAKKIINNKFLINNKTAKNIIFVIVDGMGFEYVKAARIYNGQRKLNFENYTCQTSVTTCALESSGTDQVCLDNHDHVTDSAAAATAMATGQKVNNGVISKNINTNNGNIETILEYAQKLGKSTGIIATKLFTDATPAAFVSHANNRHDTKEILEDIFQRSLPNIIFGADTKMHRQAAQKSPKKYHMIHSATDLSSLVPKYSKLNSCLDFDCFYIYGGFGQHSLIPNKYEKISGLPLAITSQKITNKLDTPKLSNMTYTALKILNQNKNGFFLMVESSMPDIIGHHSSNLNNNTQTPSAIEALMAEMAELQKTMSILEKFVKNNPDTLIILTADHETGGLVIDHDKTNCLGKKFCVPVVNWTSPKYSTNPDSLHTHTNLNVPLYALGVGAERFCQPQINNTDIKNLAILP